jgi:N-acetylglucosaminyl-diphospho-decaprenol L-rhamnosyltransferase
VSGPTAPARHTVAVLVVTYNSASVVTDLLLSLGAGLAGVAWHLTIADNASGDDTVPVIRKLAPDATLVEMGRNAGYAAGINAAAAAAGPRTALLVLNPDVRLAPGCVAELLTGLTPDAGLAVPRLLDRNSQLVVSMRREPTVLRAWGDALLGASRAGRIPILGEVVTAPGHYLRPGVTDWAEGSTLLITAACWERCGPWDEGFFLYSEETDFALRARDAGFVTRYVPSAGATHLEGESGQSPPLWTLLTINRVRLFRLRHGRVETAAYWAALVCREGTRALLGKQTSKSAVRALLSPQRLREPRGPHSLLPRHAAGAN